MARILNELDEYPEAHFAVLACVQFPGWANYVEEVQIHFQLAYEPIF